MCSWIHHCLNVTFQAFTLKLICWKYFNHSYPLPWGHFFMLLIPCYTKVHHKETINLSSTSAWIVKESIQTTDGRMGPDFIGTYSSGYQSRICAAFYFQLRKVHLTDFHLWKQIRKIDKNVSGKKGSAKCIWIFHVGYLETWL